MTLFNVYSLYPVEPVRGKGCFVYNAAGTTFTADTPSSRSATPSPTT